MAMTNERENLLATYLSADEARTKALFEIPAADAVAKINADGYDFTVEEIQEYGAKLVAMSESNSGELSEDSLDDVSGGITIATATLAFSIIKWGAPYAWRAGQWIGSKITGR